MDERPAGRGARPLRESDCPRRQGCGSRSTRHRKRPGERTSGSPGSASGRERTTHEPRRSPRSSPSTVRLAAEPGRRQRRGRSAAAARSAVPGPSSEAENGHSSTAAPKKDFVSLAQRHAPRLRKCAIGLSLENRQSPLTRNLEDGYGRQAARDLRVMGVMAASKETGRTSRLPPKALM